MKRLKILLLIPVLTVFSFNTMKTDLPVRVYGSWFGQYGSGTAAPSIFYAFHFKYSGHVVVESTSEATPSLGTGKWQLYDDTVKGTYTYVYGAASGTYSFAMKVSETSAIGTGTWGTGTSTTGGGTFEMKKE